MRGKFRGKRVDGEGWEKGWLVETLKATFILCSITSDNARYGPPCFVHEYIEVQPDTVGQYTGRKDKNGVEIYCGDIVRYYTGTKYNGKKEYREAPIEFVSAVAQFNIVDKGWVFDLSCKFIQADLEVIGNIHEEKI